MKLKEVVAFLEQWAPPVYQENYDNSGWIVGNPEAVLTGVLVCLDTLECIVEEAIKKNCNLIISHHPIIFRGLKRLTGKNYVERTVIQAIKQDIAIYAMHTNLDNMLQNGVNQKIAQRLGLKNLKILAPKPQTLMHLIAFVPIEYTQKVLNALYAAGAGQIGNYKNCSFRSIGTGTFKPVGNAQPYLGAIDKEEEVQENRIEVIFEVHLKNKILSALRKAHPYEEVAYYLNSLENEHTNIGAGIVGDCEQVWEELPFLKFVKQQMCAGIVRHTALRGQPVQRVAICGGSGSFLLSHAMRAGAQVFVTADFKYHEFFDADNAIIIADIGHFESEQYTIELICGLLAQQFEKISVFSTEKITNPVNYL